jgi:hypothetical protein
VLRLLLLCFSVAEDVLHSWWLLAPAAGSATAHVMSTFLRQIPSATAAAVAAVWFESGWTCVCCDTVSKACGVDHQQHDAVTAQTQKTQGLCSACTSLASLDLVHNVHVCDTTEWLAGASGISLFLLVQVLLEFPGAFCCTPVTNGTAVSMCVVTASKMADVMLAGALGPSLKCDRQELQ